MLRLAVRFGRTLLTVLCVLWPVNAVMLLKSGDHTIPVTLHAVDCVEGRLDSIEVVGVSPRGTPHGFRRQGDSCRWDLQGVYLRQLEIVAGIDGLYGLRRVEVALGDVRYGWDIAMNEAPVASGQMLLRRAGKAAIVVPLPRAHGMRRSLLPMARHAANWKGDGSFIRATFNSAFVLASQIAVLWVLWRWACLKGRVWRAMRVRVCRGFNDEPCISALVAAGTMLVGGMLCLPYRDLVHAQVRSLDEYALYVSLRSMWIGLCSGDLRGFLNPGLESYGYPYFCAFLGLTWPWLLMDHESMVIFFGRILSVIFAAASMVVVYRANRLFLERSAALVSTALLAAMPAVWSTAAWVHPDWMMTFFLLSGGFYLLRDRGRFGSYYWLAVSGFALAIAVKLQALQFCPVLAGYIIITKRRAPTVWTAIKRTTVWAVQTAVYCGLVYVLLNPRLLFPWGRAGLIANFTAQLTSNATNHGAGGVCPLGEKLAALELAFLPLSMQVGLLGVMVWVVFRFLRRRDASGEVAIACGVLMALAYNLIRVNKSFGYSYYYLGPISLGLLVVPRVLRHVQPVIRFLLLGGLLIFQVSAHRQGYSRLIRDWHGSQVDWVRFDRSSDFILRVLQPMVGNGACSVLMSPYTGFDYRRVGMRHENVHIIFGLLEPSDLGAEFIILRKDDVYFRGNEAERGDGAEMWAATDLVRRLGSGELGYRLVDENEDIVIYRWEEG